MFVSGRTTCHGSASPAPGLASESSTCFARRSIPAIARDNLTSKAKARAWSISRRSVALSVAARRRAHSCRMAPMLPPATAPTSAPTIAARRSALAGRFTGLRSAATAKPRRRHGVSRCPGGAQRSCRCHPGIVPMRLRARRGRARDGGRNGPRRCGSSRSRSRRRLLEPARASPRWQVSMHAWIGPRKTNTTPLRSIDERHSLRVTRGSCPK